MGLEKLSSLKENFTWNASRHQNAYGDISSLPLRAPLKGAEVFRNTKAADIRACVHAEIDKSFIAPRSRQKWCLCCQMTTPPLPSSPFQKQPFFRVHSRRESDLIKKHTKYKVALLYSHFLKSCLGLPLFCRDSSSAEKFPSEEAFRAPWRHTHTRVLGAGAGLVWGGSRVQWVLQRGAAQTLFLPGKELRLVDILLSIENAISLHIEFLLVKFGINTPSRPLSNFCLCLLTNRVWQPELGEQPLSDPVTRNFYYSQLELRKRWFVFIKLPACSSAFHSYVKQPEHRAAAAGHCGAAEKFYLRN